MRWRPEFIRFIGKRGDDFIVVPDIARILSPNAIDLVAEQASSDRKSASVALAGG